MANKNTSTFFCVAKHTNECVEHDKRVVRPSLADPLPSVCGCQDLLYG